MDQFCIKCGKLLGPGGVCPKCGSAAQPAPAPQQPVYAPQQPAPQQPVYAPQQSAPQKKKKRNPILIVAAAAAAVLVLGLGGYFLGKAVGLFGGSDNGPGGRPGTGPEDVPQVTVTRPAADEYLASYGTVTQREPAKSADLLTESEALAAFSARGFADLEITVCYDADGVYTDEREITPDGKEKHPYYSAAYLTPDNDLWTLFLMGNVFYAEPISFNAVQRHDGPIVLSEAGRYVTYDGKENAFLTLEPKEDALILKRVDRIDAETLNGLDAWEVAEL